MPRQVQILTQRCGATAVSIAHGKAPVINASSSDLGSEIPMALNFLRSGCGPVQIAYHYQRVNDDNLEKARGYLAALELENETLGLNVGNEDKHWCIITVTRLTK